MPERGRRARWPRWNPGGLATGCQAQDARRCRKAELIEALLDRPQPADLVAGFSLPLPAQVICEMLGVPAADTGQFHAWSDTIVGDWQRDSDEIMTALVELYGYFGRLIETKRARPADDQMSAVTPGEPDLLGGRLFRLRHPTGTRKRSWRPEPGTGTSPR